MPPPASNPPSHAQRAAVASLSEVAAYITGSSPALVVAGYFLYPAVEAALNTVSTDDAYVNGHVTFVAPRVSGQVSRVLVDDNYRVKKGDLVVQLDKEPYQVQVAIKKAAVEVAETDFAAAQAQVRSQVGLARAYRFRLEHTIEDVHTQIANLRANVANYESQKAMLVLAQANLKRGEELLPSGGISKEDLDQRRQTVKVDEADVDQALQAIYATRVGLGLPSRPAQGQDLGDVPADLDQNFSSVRQALFQLSQTAAESGLLTGLMERKPESKRSRNSTSLTPRAISTRSSNGSSRTLRRSSRPWPSASRPAPTWIRLC